MSLMIRASILCEPHFVTLFIEESQKESPTSVFQFKLSPKFKTQIAILSISKTKLHLESRNSNLANGFVSRHQLDNFDFVQTMIFELQFVQDCRSPKQCLVSIAQKVLPLNASINHCLTLLSV